MPPAVLDHITNSRLVLVILAVLGLCITVTPFLEDERLQEKSVGNIGDIGPTSFESPQPLTMDSSKPHMYALRRTEEHGGQTMKFLFADVSFAAAMRLFEAAGSQGYSFRSQVIQAVQEVPFPAVFWECKPVNGATASEAPFEFVVSTSADLAQVSTGDPEPFAEHLSRLCDAGPSASVVTFSNLGRDAVLVSPCPRPSVALSAAQSDYGEYAHLAPFVRHAPVDQVHGLFQAIGAAALERLGLRDTLADSTSAKPLWLSTSGLGVYWLHVRLDDHPKYYTYRAYKNSA